MTPIGFSRLLVIAFVFTGNYVYAATLTLPSRVTRVDVTDNNMHVIKRIDSQREISAIVAFVAQRRSGWIQPLAGVPVARLYADFYEGDRLVGHFGVGPGFFETSLAGDHFRSRGAAESETQAFLSLIGMERTELQ
jgi:hypothetical protein